MRGLSLLLLASYSDQNVETALQVAFRAIPADCRVPFLTIPAVDALTPMDITADGLDAYARRYTDGTNGYEAQAPQRGVVVQVVNNKSFDCVLRMARHFVFVLFESGREVPQCDAGYRGRFYELKRLVDTLWSTNQYRLSTELLKQNLTKGSNPPRYHQSLACEFLGVPDSLGSKPDRVTRAAAITRIGIIMSGYESFLEFPEPATKDNSKRQRLLPPLLLCLVVFLLFLVEQQQHHHGQRRHHHGGDVERGDRRRGRLPRVLPAAPRGREEQRAHPAQGQAEQG